MECKVVIKEYIKNILLSVLNTLNPLKNQVSKNGFLEHWEGSINRRNDPMPLQLVRIEEFLYIFQT